MPSRIIAERAFAFAVRIVKLCETLWTRSRAAQSIADQLFDAGTSIGANAHEAEGAQTKPDFLAKLGISRKESWETIFWLRLGIVAGVIKRDEASWELDEAQQLRAMITAAIKTGQSSSWRGGEQCDFAVHQPSAISHQPLTGRGFNPGPFIRPIHSFHR